MNTFKNKPLKTVKDHQAKRGRNKKLVDGYKNNSMKDKTSKMQLSVHDIFQIRNISDVEFSPDGEYIVCVITTPHLNENTRNSCIALVSIDDNDVQLVTEGESPCWSPNGTKIAYQAKKDENNGIWIYDIENQAHQFVTSVYNSNYFLGHEAIRNFEWSPDGKKIAYLSTEKPPERDEKAEVRVFSRLLYKSRGGRTRPYYSDRSYTHLYVISVDNGNLEQVTEGNYHNHSISWSPDSEHIAFISNRTKNPELNHKNNLWSVDIRTNQLTKLTNDFGTVLQPAWSPCSNKIALLAVQTHINTKDSPAADTHLYIIDSDGNNLRCLTGQFDRRITNIEWGQNGDSIYFTAGDCGITGLYKTPKDSELVEAVIKDYSHILEYSITPEGTNIAYVQSDMAHPSEVFIFSLKEDKPTQLTEQNASFVDDYSITDAEMFWFKSFDQTDVQGWITKPANFSSYQKYPLILVIHSGPHNMFGYEFEARMQLLAANGYGVLFINPRGSSGYGQDFSRGTLMNWGGGDYKDLMYGVDYVLDHYEWIDKDRLGVTGQSYGGYMTNWIITQTNRFKAAVVDGGLSNLISFSGTSIFQLLMETEFNGQPWDIYPLLWQWSPLRNVKNVETPTLFLHGKKDNEVPVSQAEEMYSALKKRGVDTTFVQYMNEGHGWRPDLTPKNRCDLYKRTISWFDKYI